MLIRADARALPLKDESVHCVVTSPPFFGLRDYGCNGQLGLERLHDCLGWATGAPCGECYVCHLVAVFREVRRVLRPDGVVFLNLGDSYAGSGPSGASYQSTTTKRRAEQKTDGNFQISKTLSDRGLTYAEKKPIPPPGLKPKDLCGIPWRVAFALQADGWYLRSDIIWHKPNPMPESVTDRPTKSHEYLFLLAKQESYFYDVDAIREKASLDTHARYARGRSDTHKWADGGPGDQTIAKTFKHMLKTDEHPSRRVRGFNQRWDEKEALRRAPGVGPKAAAPGSGIKNNVSFQAAVSDAVEYRNKRSVWTIPTEPFSGAHFATFPRKLVEPCILAGTSERGCCPKCGAPWERAREKTRAIQLSAKGSRFDRGKTGARDGGDRTQEGERFETVTVGWQPGCSCNAGEPVPCTVLDPFCGSGTTVRVAESLNRRGIGIDLSGEYLSKIARRRITNVQRVLKAVSHA